MLVKLSSKGQLIIPKPVRKALGVEQGTQFHVRLQEGSIVLVPVAPSPISALYGKYSDVDFLADLEQEHRQEVDDEAAICA